MIDELDDLMAEFEVDALFLEGISIHKPNLFYVTGFLTVDSAYYVKIRGQEPLLAASDLVCERAQKHSPMRNFHSTSPIIEKALHERWLPSELDRHIVEDLGKQLLPREGVVGIPRDTDAQVVADLRNSGVETKPVQDLFFRARETKSPQETRAIEEASRATEATFERVVDIIQNATVSAKRVLFHDGEPLTVGRVKREIEHSLVDFAAENSQESIVAGGVRSADYHYIGQRKDVLRANEPIIVDIYPRRLEERYHADITRTIIHGNVSGKLRKMFEAVEASIDAVVDAIQVGCTTEELVNVMADSLERDGYPSAHRTPGIKEGMLHGLGHGIGLDVHELPRVSLQPNPIREGAVFTLEPGLYYESIGGVRIEDNVVITKKGARVITRLPRTFFL